MTRKSNKNGRRAVVVDGVRTPFVKAFKEFTKVDTIALGVTAVRALLKRNEVPRREIDQLIWGSVIIPSGAPNVGREVVLDLRLPPEIHAHTVSQACISSLHAITGAASAIERGDADVVIAGGSDSTSNAEIKLPQKVVHALAPLAFGKATPQDVLGVLAQLWPLHELLPKRPEVAERTTGKTMGESCEDMARRNEISREAQDAFAARSHQRAAAAMESGRFDAEVTPVKPPDGPEVTADRLVRADTSEERLARLRPVFAKDGTITAGNASPLTDGAAAVLMMSEEAALALGYKPEDLVHVKQWAYAGVDPTDQLLIGPALAVPQVLERVGLGLQDMDLVDFHEAFAAQVLCVQKAMASKAFCRERLGLDQPVGEVDPERLNVHGGSVSIGHPFAATGARMVTTMMNELRLRDAQHALLAACAAGGLANALVLERLGG